MDTSQLKGCKEPMPVKKIGPFYWQKGVLGLLKKDYEYYITTGNPYDLATWPFIILSKFYKKRVIFWTHGAYGRENSLKRIITKWKMRQADLLFLYGNYGKNILNNWGIPESKMYVIYNSLDYDTQLKERNSLAKSRVYNEHFHNTFPVLVFIGRLIPDKQLNRVIDAISILKKEKGQLVNFVLIGEGAEKESLAREAQSLDVSDQIWFYGACYDEHVNAELIFSADVCVSPGPIGLTAIHSLMFGTPVITHDDFSHQGPEFEAIEKGVSGDFFAFQDTNSLADCLSRWILTHKNRESIRSDCQRIIDERYNPHVQLETIKRALNY